MKTSTAAILLLGAIVTSCERGQPAASLETPSRLPSSPPVTVGASALFLDTDEESAPSDAPQIVRQRFVKVNLGLLLSAEEKPRSEKEITINLFPDVIYTGVIEKVEFDGGGYSWRGHLRGVEYSSMAMVCMAGVFIGHFASPKGVYEVSAVGESNLYRVALIDQQKLPRD